MSSTQRENSAPGCGMQQFPKQNVYKFKPFFNPTLELSVKWYLTRTIQGVQMRMLLYILTLYWKLINKSFKNMLFIAIILLIVFNLFQREMTKYPPTNIMNVPFLLCVFISPIYYIHFTYINWWIFLLFQSKLFDNRFVYSSNRNVSLPMWIQKKTRILGVEITAKSNNWRIEERVRASH